MNGTRLRVAAYRLAASAAIVGGVVLSLAQPASAGLLDGKVAIVTGAARGVGR